MIQNKVLGTSFTDLLKENPNNNTNDNKMLFVNIEQIEPTKSQPRKHFDEESLNELAISIKNNGLIQPIIVHQVAEKKYKIISGERRYRASLKIGLEKIPVVIKESNYQDILKLSLIENIQREDLNVIEEAKGYKNLIDSFNYSHMELSSILGKSRSYISNILRLLQLPEFVQNMLIKNEISQGHARSIIGISNVEEIATKIKEENLSVREVEKLVSKLNSNSTGQSKNFTSEDIKNLKNDLEYISNIITSKTGLKTNIKSSHGGKGTVSIFFKNLEELEKFIERIQKISTKQ